MSSIANESATRSWIQGANEMGNDEETRTTGKEGSLDGRCHLAVSHYRALQIHDSHLGSLNRIDARERDGLVD